MEASLRVSLHSEQDDEDEAAHAKKPRGAPPVGDDNERCDWDIATGKWVQKNGKDYIGRGGRGGRGRGRGSKKLVTTGRKRSPSPEQPLEHLELRGTARRQKVSANMNMCMVNLVGRPEQLSEFLMTAGGERYMAIMAANKNLV